MFGLLLFLCESYCDKACCMDLAYAKTLILQPYCTQRNQIAYNFGLSECNRVNEGIYIAIMIYFHVISMDE